MATKNKKVEFWGIVRGVLADDVVTPVEIHFLHDFLLNEMGKISEPDIKAVFEKINFICTKQGIYQKDCDELLHFLRYLLDEDNKEKPIQEFNIQKESVRVDFNRTTFCFTGNFAFLSREDCIKLVKKLQCGVALKDINMDVNYLVVGNKGSAFWKHKTYGKKIETALQINAELEEMNSKERIGIISEDYFLECVQGYIGCSIDEFLVKDA